ncbi:hypothetical protein D027_4670B, partial [Vibrio parahaemolyticus 861]
SKKMNVAEAKAIAE